MVTEIKGIETFDGVITDYYAASGHGHVRIKVPIMIAGVPVQRDFTFKFDLCSYSKTRKVSSSVPDVGVAAKVTLTSEGHVLRVTQDGIVYHHMNLSTLSFTAISDGHKKAIVYPFDNTLLRSDIDVGDCIEVCDPSGLRSVTVVVTYVEYFHNDDHEVLMHSIQRVNA